MSFHIAESISTAHKPLSPTPKYCSFICNSSLHTTLALTTTDPLAAVPCALDIRNLVVSITNWLHQRHQPQLPQRIFDSFAVSDYGTRARSVANFAATVPQNTIASATLVTHFAATVRSQTTSILSDHFSSLHLRLSQTVTVKVCSASTLAASLRLLNLPITFRPKAEAVCYN